MWGNDLPLLLVEIMCAQTLGVQGILLLKNCNSSTEVGRAGNVSQKSLTTQWMGVIDILFLLWKMAQKHPSKLIYEACVWKYLIMVSLMFVPPFLPSKRHNSKSSSWNDKRCRAGRFLRCHHRSKCQMTTKEAGISLWFRTTGKVAEIEVQVQSVLMAVY